MLTAGPFSISTVHHLNRSTAVGLLVAGLAMCLLAASGCSGPAGSAGEPTHHSPKTLLTPSATTIDLGIVPQAGREQETFSLTNCGTKPVEISKIETSCDCLDIRLSRRVIGPSEKLLATTSLDLSKEPNFLGGLAIEVKGLTGSGDPAFSIVVDVTVRPREEFPEKEDPS